MPPAETMTAMREFNIAGPVVEADHYLIPPLSRLDLDDLLGLVRDKKYFVLHAPRQTGKTSALLALRDLLNGATSTVACTPTSRVASRRGRTLPKACAPFLAELAFEASCNSGRRELEEIWPAALTRVGPHGALRQALARWCLTDAKPLVLLIDEIDSLIGTRCCRCSGSCAQDMQLGRGGSRTP